jgi:Hint domain
MSETFSGSWDVYSVTLTGGTGVASGDPVGATLTLEPGTPAVETSDGFDDFASGGTSIANNTDGVSDSSTNLTDFNYNGSITVGAVTGYLINDGAGDYFLVVGSGVDVSAGLSGAFTQNADTWSFTNTTPFCFAAGTMIATPEGARAVETLATGDLVLTAGGPAKPVRWLGRNTVSRLFADPTRVLPIRVKAGALGENLPVRDLLLSPCHALLIEGALVQAAALVNGSSVLRETATPAVFTYYHVELDSHDVLLAEGVAAESFLTGVENMGFDNLADRPATAEGAAELGYPRVKSARQLPASVRALLAARAAVIAADLQIAA